MMNRFLLVPALLLAALLTTTTPTVRAQTAPRIERINPTNWWVGMKYRTIQLLVYGPNAGTLAFGP